MSDPVTRLNAALEGHYAMVGITSLMANNDAFAPSLYFPPDNGAWESVDPASVGRDAEKLSAALDVAGDRRSSGMLILHDGRIMAERYWEIGNPPVWLEL